MKTTIDLPEQILRGAQLTAARLGLGLSEFIASAIAREINIPPATKPPSGQNRPRSELPSIKARGKGGIPNITAALQAQLEDEEDLGSYNRSLGR